jgi:glycosyltransferase involved in cell wall biosynthesis
LSPLVSIVVSHYDRREFLAEALASIAAQTFRDFEVLVVSDAGPPVDAPSWARVVRRAERGGVAAVRNTGIAAARGSRIAHLDDDDLWEPRHLEVLSAALDRGAALAYGDARIVRIARGNGPPLAWPMRDQLTLAVPFAYDDLARDDFVVPGGMMHTRALYDEVGPFDESLFVSDDWDWLLRAARVTDFLRVPEVVITVRIHGDNLSALQDPRRRQALDTLETRHGTPHLEPKTFWEVAKTYAARVQ